MINSASHWLASTPVTYPFGRFMSIKWYESGYGLLKWFLLLMPHFLLLILIMFFLVLLWTIFSWFVNLLAIHSLCLVQAFPMRLNKLTYSFPIFRLIYFSLDLTYEIMNFAKFFIYIQHIKNHTQYKSHVQLYSFMCL